MILGIARKDRRKKGQDKMAESREARRPEFRGVRTHPMTPEDWRTKGQRA